jgi:hypothetical protein
MKGKGLGASSIPGKNEGREVLIGIQEFMQI